MKMAHKISGAATGLLVAALFTTTVTPAFAETTPSSSTDPINVSQAAELTPEQEALATEVTELTSAVDQASKTLDLRKLSDKVSQSDTAKAFVSEYSANGGSVINSDGTTSPSHPTARSAKASSAEGRIWQDARGAHITVPKDTMDRLATLAATGSGAAGAVAALLAANIEGFPISTGGALAAGAVALGLIAAAGALQICNINGNGAQANYNWVLWTCWPL